MIQILAERKFKHLALRLLLNEERSNFHLIELDTVIFRNLWTRPYTQLNLTRLTLTAPTIVACRRFRKIGNATFLRSNKTRGAKPTNQSVTELVETIFRKRLKSVYYVTIKHLKIMVDNFILNESERDF